MKAKRGGYTIQQYAYAQRTFNGKGVNKKQIALDVGYSPSIAQSVHCKIEKREGFKVAMLELARQSNNLALAALKEFDLRGLDSFSNKDLIAALNAIGSAWSRFNDRDRYDDEDGGYRSNRNNKLRTVVLQQIEQQTVNTIPTMPAMPIEDTQLASEEEKNETA